MDADVGRAVAGRRLLAHFISRTLSALDQVGCIFIKGCQRHAGRAGLALCDVGRAAFKHQLSAASAPFGAELDDPVRIADHIEVVLDDDQAMAFVEQA